MWRIIYEGDRRAADDGRHGPQPMGVQHMYSSRKRHRLRIIIPAYPAFNIYSRIAKKTTALGPVYVASSVAEMEGWDSEVIDENNYRRYAPRNRNGMPDHAFLQRARPAEVIGFYGGLTSTIPRLYELARFYKTMGVTTVVGGQHFVGDNIREALDNGIDYVVVGEGEETIKEILAVIEGKRDRNGVKGIAYLREGEIVHTAARDPITDFDKLPLPNFSLVRYAKIKLYPVSRVRGCGMNCEFCTVKGQARYASPERLFEQISYVVETVGTRRFFIVDDLFGQRREETLQLCRLLTNYQRKIGRRLDLTVQIRLDKARDHELLRAMREAGVDTVAVGFESPIREELKAMNKHLNPEDMLSLIRTFHRFGFLVHGMFIFGYPMGQGIEMKMPAAERVTRFRRFIRKAKVDTIQVLLPVPLPGTELRQRLESQGRIFPLDEVGWEYYDGNFPLFKPDKPMTAEDMQTSLRKIMGKFYQFRHMFMVGMRILSFPAIVFFLHNLKLGWQRWYRPWRNHLMRFLGWIVLRRWTFDLEKGPFRHKLERARRALEAKSSTISSYTVAPAENPAQDHQTPS